MTDAACWHFKRHTRGGGRPQQGAADRPQAHMGARHVTPHVGGTRQWRRACEGGWQATAAAQPERSPSQVRNAPVPLARTRDADSRHTSRDTGAPRGEGPTWSACTTGTAQARAGSHPCWHTQGQSRMAGSLATLHRHAPCATFTGWRETSLTRECRSYTDTTPPVADSLVSDMPAIDRRLAAALSQHTAGGW